MIVPSKKRIRGRQKQTRFESLDSTAAANTQELFDESPDVPTVDTPTHDNLITNVGLCKRHCCRINMFVYMAFINVWIAFSTQKHNCLNIESLEKMHLTGLQ